MSIIRIPTNFNIEIEFEIPEFYRRLIALMIDLLLEFFYLQFIGQILNNMSSGGIDAYAIFLLLILPVMLYHLVLEVTMNGQSIGKKIMGIRVVNEIGGRPGISQFLIRWLLRISDLWMMIIFYLLLNDPNLFRDADSTFLVLAALGFLVTDIVLVVSTKKGQRIGDILAKTILIRTNTRGSIDDTVFVAVADNYIPAYPQIMQLSDKDINAIKSILESAKKRGDFTMAENAGQKIKTHLQIESDLPPLEFLDVLLKDYNYLSTK